MNIEEHNKTRALLNAYQEARNALEQFDPDNCPLDSDHYSLSEELFGSGVWRWTCGFCGKEFEQ